MSTDTVAAQILTLSGAHGFGLIRVDATEAPGTVIHRSHVDPDVRDSLVLYANNDSGTEVLLSVDWGTGSASMDDWWYARLPPWAHGYQLVEGREISGTGSGSRVIRAFADRAGVVVIYGEGTRVGELVTLH